MHAAVWINARSKATGEYRHGLLDAETQGIGRDADIQSARQQIRHLQLQTTARSHDHAQVGRCVVQEIGQRITGGGFGQRIGLIEDQHGFHAEVGDFRQPIGQAVEPVPGRGHRPPGVHRKRLPPAAQRHGGGQAMDEAAAIVMGIEGQPGDHRTAGEKFAAPLRQQQGLAETGRSVHRNGQAVSQIGRIDAEPLAHLSTLLIAGRRCLENQFGLYPIHVGDASLRSRALGDRAGPAMADDSNAWAFSCYGEKVMP
ncbi:hypothetical protein D9M68_600150 [compost metagenome]